MNKNWQYVNKKDFDEFINTYPYRLICDTYMDACTWNDVRDGRMYPDSVIAIASLYGDDFKICRDYIAK